MPKKDPVLVAIIVILGGLFLLALGSFYYQIRNNQDTSTRVNNVIREFSSINPLQGPPGPVGEKGDTGVQGSVGPAGPVGATGEEGASTVGPRGPRGARGSQGAQGVQGEPAPVVEMRCDAENNMVEWRNEGDILWTQLYPVETCGEQQ